MTIEAKVIADSTGPKCKRLTTFQLRYPRFIHAELMTHRVFSRNASSSRAIPVKKMIEDVLTDPAMPIHWGRNQPGMQAQAAQNEAVVVPCFNQRIALPDGGGVYSRVDLPLTPRAAWLAARDRAVEVAQAFDAARYHKQLVNRILEPFTHISVVVTASNYENFYWLRRHPDAQPEIRALADAMWEAHQASTPRSLTWGDWHLPYITDEERNAVEFVYGGHGNVLEMRTFEVDALIKMSVARCARVSYLTHEGKKPDPEQDMALYERLVGSVPLHASPAEHQATPDQMSWGEHDIAIWDNPHLSGNFDRGWIQYRKTLRGEYYQEHADD
jgi:Thymidylate synthase complementing protein